MQLAQISPAIYQTQANKDRVRSELSNSLDISRLLKEIDSRPGLIGAGVVYFNGFDVLIVREFEPVCQIKPINVIIRAVPKNIVTASQPTNGALELQNQPMYSAVREATSTGIACGAAVLSWVVIIGSGMAAVPTAGASAAITVLGYSAAFASTAQCLVGAGRTGAVFAGNEDSLAWLDSTAWYNKTMIALDVVSIVGAGSAAATSIKTLQNLKAAGSASVLQAMKQMPRHERKRLTETIIRQMHPGISNAALKAYVRAGVYPARYTATQVSHSLKMQLADAVGATLSFSGSAMSGVIRNPSQAKELVFGISSTVNAL